MGKQAKQELASDAEESNQPHILCAVRKWNPTRGSVWRLVGLSTTQSPKALMLTPSIWAARGELHGTFCWLSPTLFNWCPGISLGQRTHSHLPTGRPKPRFVSAPTQQGSLFREHPPSPPHLSPPMSGTVRPDPNRVQDPGPQYSPLRRSQRQVLAEEASPGSQGEENECLGMGSALHPSSVPQACKAAVRGKLAAGTPGPFATIPLRDSDPSQSPRFTSLCSGQGLGRLRSLSAFRQGLGFPYHPSLKGRAFIQQSFPFGRRQNYHNPKTGSKSSGNNNSWRWTCPLNISVPLRWGKQCDLLHECKGFWTVPGTE